MKVLCLVVLVLLTASRIDAQECVMSEWSDWGPCEASGVDEAASSTDTEGEYEAPPENEGDIGREMMRVLKATKANQWSYAAECRAEGTCPQYNFRPSDTLVPVACVDGLSGDYPCHLIDMMSHLSLEDLGYTTEVQEELRDYGPKGNDIWGWTDPWTNNEYALMGTSGGTSFVDVSDPLRPNVLAFLKTRTEPSSWRDIKVYNNTAYIGSEAYYHGMQVFDLTRLRDMVDFSYVESDYDYLGFGNSHNIVSDEETGYVYAVGSRQIYDENRVRSYEPCKGGFHIMDVTTDRLRPTFVGCHDDDGYIHDAQCVVYHGPQRRYQGHHVCFNYNEDTLTIVDMTDKTWPIVISKTGYTGAMYTHQGWVTEDHTTLLLDDELDEFGLDLPTQTFVWDVSRLDKPRLRALHKSHNLAIDHNQYIYGGIAYQSNYGSGLRMLDVDTENYELREVAYFDVLPYSSDRPEFEGTWSNYPYFASGNVIVSSIEFGLYVVRPDYEQIRAAIASNRVYYEQTRTRMIVSAGPGAVCPSEVQPRQCSPEK